MSKLILPIFATMMTSLYLLLLFLLYYRIIQVKQRIGLIFFLMILTFLSLSAIIIMKIWVGLLVILSMVLTLLLIFLSLKILLNKLFPEEKSPTFHSHVTDKELIQMEEPKDGSGE